MFPKWAVDRVRPRGVAFLSTATSATQPPLTPVQTPSLRPDGDVLLVFSRLSPKNRGEREKKILNFWTAINKSGRVCLDLGDRCCWITSRVICMIFVYTEMPNPNEHRVILYYIHDVSENGQGKNQLPLHG